MKKILFLLVVFGVIFLLNGCKLISKETKDDISFIPFEEIPVKEEGIIETKPSQLPPEKPGEEIITPESLEVEEGKEALPKIVVNEAEMVRLNLKATDPDGDPITYTYSRPLNEKGEWQTKVGDAGEYRVIISASDGKSTTTQDLLIIVKHKNQPPVIEIVKDVTVNEGETVSFSPVVTDPENDNIFITYSGWMSSSTYKTDYDDAGKYAVVVMISDGTNKVSQEVKVTVNNVNRAPILSELKDVTIKEGETVRIGAIAADPDNDPVVIKYSAPLNDNGEWETDIGDAGSYTVMVSASDGKLESKREVLVSVLSLNKPPVLEVVSEINVKEGESVSLSPVVTDPEGREVVVKYSGWMSSSTYKTDYDDAGTYTVIVTASDGINEVIKEVKVNVGDVNRPPVFIWE